MAAISNDLFREAYTFDDVLLKPGLSDVMPSEVDVRSDPPMRRVIMQRDPTRGGWSPSMCPLTTPDCHSPNRAGSVT